MDIDTIKSELKSATENVHMLVQRQSEEIKQYGASTLETAKELKAATAKYDESIKAMDDRLSNIEAKANRPHYGVDQQIKATPGMQFVMSEEFKSAGKRGTTDSVNVGNLFGTKNIDPTVGDGQDRAPVFPERVPEIYFDPGQREMTLRDIMNIGQTTSNSVDFFVEKDFDEDGATSQNGEGGLKAQQQMQFEKKSANVETIAAWLPVSRQVLDDAAMLQSHIDNRLVYSVNKELEDQILFGSGASGQLLGIHNTPGVETIGAPTGKTTQLDLIRRAIAAVRLSEYAATGVILNPSDWATIELTKGDDEHYIWVSVPEGGVPRLWRVPVVETTAMQEGRFLTGAFGLGAQLWDRMTSTVRISDSHAEYFTSNLVAILAELRVALTTYRPKAFVKGVLDQDLST
jgi:HK97 family phage major capsid protein